SLVLSLSDRHPNLQSFPTRRSSDLVDRKIKESLKFIIDSQNHHIDLSVHCQNPVERRNEQRRQRQIKRRRYTDGIQAAKQPGLPDRKSTRLNSSHVSISYAVFCLNK